jgi:AraC family transcriptional regulator, arabinose operon regulatory protein
VHVEAEVLYCGYSYHSKTYRHQVERLPYFLFRLQTEGTARALVQGDMKSIEPGDLLLFQPGEEYGLGIDPDQNSAGGSGDYFLACQGEWIKQWWDRSEKPQCTRIDLDAPILSHWRQLDMEKRRVHEVEPELLAYLLGALCVSLERAVLGAASLKSHSNLEAKLTSDRMKRYIEDHATKGLRVEDVASHVLLSVSRAAHVFKETFGLSIMQYALEIRLSNALDRIRYTSMSLEQVADNCGFKSYPYFHKAFKRKYGLSPKDFRPRTVLITTPF